MKLILSGQRSLAIMGINPHQNLFNLKFLFAMVIHTTNVEGNWMFLIHEANTFVEYANSIFMTSTITVSAVCVVIIAFERSLIFVTIDLFEKLVDKSENSQRNFSSFENHLISRKLKICRIENASAEIDVRGSKSSGRKMVKIGIHRICHIDSDNLCFTESHVRLLDVLYHISRK